MVLNKGIVPQSNTSHKLENTVKTRTKHLFKNNLFTLTVLVFFIIIEPLYAKFTQATHRKQEG